MKSPDNDSRVLVVDDDRKTVDLICLYLEKSGFQVITAYNGSKALELARREQPDLVILDLMLPQISGLNVCRILRSESDVPIIMLTARTTEDDKLSGLELGADDYVTKPFSPRELVARVHAVLRRARKPELNGPSEIQLNDLTVDFVRHEVRRADHKLNITPREFRILETLARQPGRAFSRLQLLEIAFGYDYEGLERTVDVHIMNLRKKIEKDPAEPRYILTVYGIGYKMSEDVAV